MKKLLSLILSLCMVMCFMPSVAFADSTETTLEMCMDTNGEEVASGFDYKMGETISFYLFKVKWNGDKIVGQQLIKDVKGNFTLFNSEEKRAKGIMFKTNSSGKVTIKFTEASIYNEYVLKYTGS